MPTLSQLPMASAVTVTDMIPVSQAGTLRSASLGVVLQSVQPTITVDSQSLIGRTSLGSGSPEQVDVGVGLALHGSALSATGMDHASFPVASNLDPSTDLVASVLGAPTLVPVSQLRSLFSSGTNVSISDAGVISATSTAISTGTLDLGSAIDALSVVTKLSAQDLLPISQSGSGKAIAYANLIDGMTIDEAQPAGPASDTDTIWVAQSSNLMERQTFSAIWSWITGKLATYMVPSIEVTSNFTLQASLHNGHSIICSQPVLISTSNNLPSGFHCTIINTSTGNVTFGTGFLTPGGTGGLPPWQTATIRQLVYSSGSVSLVSLPTQTEGSTLPGPVVSVAASAISSTSVAVSWQQPSGSSDTLTYAVQFRVTGTASWSAGASAQTATSCQINNLTPSTSYDIAVQATNSAGTGPLSTIVNATTLAAAQVSVPTQVLGLSAAAVSSTSVQLTWTALSGTNGATSYTVQYRISGGSTWTWSVVGVTATGTIVTGLQPSTSYDLTVYGVNAAGSGPSSAAATVQTPAAPNAVSSISWNVPPAGPYSKGSGSIGVNAHVTPATAAIQFGASQSSTVPPTTWTTAVNVNSDLWGAYVPTPATAGTWYMWAEGTDGSCPTVYGTPFAVQ